MKRLRQIVAHAFVAFAAVGVLQATPPAPDYANSTLNLRSPTGRYSPQRPTISPYLAITQGTNLAFINYFTITQPLFASRFASRRQGYELQQIENQLQVEQRVDPLTGQPSIRSTGHTAGFMTQEAYFAGATKSKRHAPAGRR